MDEVRRPEAPLGDYSRWKTVPPRDGSATTTEGDGPALLTALLAGVETLEKAATESTWPLGEAALADGLALIGRLRSAADRVEVTLVGEVAGRGLADAEGASLVDWVVRVEGRDAPQPGVRHVASVVGAVQAMERSRPGAAALSEAFCSGSLPLAHAAVVAGFVRDVHRVVDRDELESAVALLVDAGSDGADGRALTLPELGEAIRFTTQLLKPAKDLESQERRMRQARALRSSPGPAGMTTYRLLLDPEGAAVVDAAVAAGSAPVAGPAGEPDLRTPAARRADALIDAVRRGSAVDVEGVPPPKAQVMVTIPLRHLQEEVRGAGLTATAQLLTPSVVRRMACDARIIPMVLGGDGAVLDVGRTERLFTAAQRRAISVRDRHCTYPGCTRPPGWCDVHHVEHWSRGGTTDLGNAALLCGRHHTLVHQRNLSATVDPTGVTWHV